MTSTRTTMQELQLSLPIRTGPGRPGEVTSFAPGVALLPAFAISSVQQLLLDLKLVASDAPLVHQVTPGGHTMSVANSSCGALGWTSSRAGYRYARHNPASGRPWPVMPSSFVQLATRAATSAGFTDFNPDSCLINRYRPGTKLALHQDRNEADYTAPIVSVSLGLPATFLLGGRVRTDRPRPLPLEHGDVLVWGGPARLRFHGVAELKPGYHPELRGTRINLTFRKAG